MSQPPYPNTPSHVPSNPKPSLPCHPPPPRALNQHLHPLTLSPTPYTPPLTHSISEARLALLLTQERERTAQGEDLRRLMLQLGADGRSSA